MGLDCIQPLKLLKIQLLFQLQGFLRVFLSIRSVSENSAFPCARSAHRFLMPRVLSHLNLCIPGIQGIDICYQSLVNDHFYSSPVTVSASVCVSVVSSVVSSVVPVTVSVSSVELCSGSAAISTIMSLAVMDVFNV